MFLWVVKETILSFFSFLLSFSLSHYPQKEKTELILEGRTDCKCLGNSDFFTLFKLMQFNVRTCQNNSWSICITCILLFFDIFEKKKPTLEYLLFVLSEMRKVLHICCDSSLLPGINTKFFMKSCNYLFSINF